MDSDMPEDSTTVSTAPTRGGIPSTTGQDLWSQAENAVASGVAQIHQGTAIESVAVSATNNTDSSSVSSGQCAPSASLAAQRSPDRTNSATPTRYASSVCADTTESGPTVEQLQRQADICREKLANGMREFKKIAEENERLRSDIKMLKSDQRSVQRAGESPEDFAALRVKNQALEKELGQVRFNAKLKIKQLQKEMQRTSSIPLSAPGSSGELMFQSLSLDAPPTEEHTRILELEEKLENASKAKDSLQNQVQAFQADMLRMKEHSKMELESLKKQHVSELSAFQTQMPPSSQKGGGFNDKMQAATLEDEYVQDMPSYKQQYDLLKKLALQYQSFDSSCNIDANDPLSIIRTVSEYFSRPTSKYIGTTNGKLTQSTTPSANLQRRNTDPAKLESNDSSLDLQTDQLFQSSFPVSESMTQPRTYPSYNYEQLTIQTGPVTPEMYKLLAEELAQERALHLQLQLQVNGQQSRHSEVTPPAGSDKEELGDSIAPLDFHAEALSKDLDYFKSQTKQALQEKEGLQLKIAELAALVSDLEQKNGKKDTAVKLSADPSALEKRNFTLEEQLKDFGLQIANRQREISTLQDSLSVRNGEYEKLQKEHEDRIRKMKGLLMAANKSMTESKKLIAHRDTDITDLKTRLESSTTSEQALRERCEALQKTIDRMGSESLDDRDSLQIQIVDLQKQLELARTESSDMRTEFQSYKVRAAAALQMSGTSAAEKRISELEDARSRLTREKRELEEQLVRIQERCHLLEADLASSLEQIALLDDSLQRLKHDETGVQVLQVEIESLTRKVVFERQVHEDVLGSLRNGHSSTIEKLTEKHKQEIYVLEEALKKACQADASLQVSSTEELKKEISKLREQVAQTQATQLRQSISSQRESISSASIPLPMIDTERQSTYLATPYLGRTSSSPSSISQWSDPSAHPFNRNAGSAVTAVPVEMTSYKEKEYQLQVQQLGDMLNDNEAEIERLHTQEKVLKEELRRIDRMDKRQDLNVEYLKNVVLSFIESDTKEPLVPIIAQILHLSPDEAQRIQKKVHVPEDEIIPSFGFFG
ncbi:hypothetical protein BASA60_004949 [Batrachochytrium salamandrivorans]|nr:hypothetical protein BASA60_004949 [Batrachochytrium salamandrivorans]